MVKILCKGRFFHRLFCLSVHGKTEIFNFIKNTRSAIIKIILLCVHEEEIERISEDPFY